MRLEELDPCPEMYQVKRWNIYFLLTRYFTDRTRNCWLYLKMILPRLAAASCRNSDKLRLFPTALPNTSTPWIYEYIQHLQWLNIHILILLTSSFQNTMLQYIDDFCLSMLLSIFARVHHTNSSNFRNYIFVQNL
jgi:hypothetical protein